MEPVVNGAAAPKKRRIVAAKKPAPAVAARTDVSKPYSAEYPVPLTEQEFLAAGKKLAKKRNDISLVEAEKSVQVAAFNAKIKAFEEESDEIAKTINTGKETRKVEVVDHKIYELGVHRVVLVKTGVILHERALTKDERQASLFGDAPVPHQPAPRGRPKKGTITLTNGASAHVEPALPEDTEINAALMNLPDEVSPTAKKGRGRPKKK
jgi:hypothetical protein